MLPLPLTTLIKQLRAAGFPLDPGREMRLRRVVHERGAEYVGRFGEMKYLLAPFVASRPEEQRNFYAFWDRYVAELEQKWEDGNKEKTDIIPSKTGGWRWLLLPLLALLAYLAYRYFNPVGPPPGGEPYAIEIGLPGAAPDSVYEKHTRLTEGDTLRLLNLTRGKLRGPDSTGFTWRIENTQTGAVERTYQTFALDMARPLVQGEGLRAILVGDHLGLPAEKSADTMLFVVQCAEPPSIPKIKVAEGAVEVGATHGFAVMDPEEGVAYHWSFGEEEAKGTSVSHAFTKEGRFTVSVQAIGGGAENIASCYSLAFIEVQVIPKGSELPILASIPLLRDEPSIFAARSVLFIFVKWILLGFILASLLWWRHRRAAEDRREKTDEEIAEAYPIFDQGPYNVPYRSRNDQISVPADFYRIADQLRVREEAEARVFDGAATIEATVSSGGFPSWRERSLHRPADYLVLITHNDEFNQQDLLLKRLTDFLSAREAAITVYYHEGQFEHFWNKDYPQGWSPDRLYDRYQHFRLLVLGNGHGLVDTYASREPRLHPDKANWLNGWARRLVLTTEPSEDWTVQEVLLHRNALLYPLTMRGLNEGVRMLNATEEYEAGNFPKWRTLQQRTNPEPSARYRKWETVADHEDYLQEDPELMRWLRGLAVTGNPDWNLTIAIGRALNIEVTHDRLLQLSRIPWLAGNRPDHDLRFALLGGLAPADETAARAVVVKELELVEDSVKGSFAQTEWQTNLAVHQLHLAPASAQQKESLREMIRAGLFTSDQLRDLELAAQRKESPVEEDLQTKTGPPPTRPGGLDRLLARDERKWWNTEPGRRFIGTLVILTGLTLFALSYLTPERTLAKGEAVPWWANINVVDDTAIEVNNEAVALWEQTDTSIKEGDGEISIENATALGTIDSKLKSALKLRNLNYPLAVYNWWRFSVNKDGYRLNAAYLDLATYKETAFRDLLEEMKYVGWAGETPEDLFLSVEHQHGLKLFGLYQTLTEKYPLDQVSEEQVNQLKKQFFGIRSRPSMDNGMFWVEGKLRNGLNVGDLRKERDSLLADAVGTLRLIEEQTDAAYFDSLTLVMPVNLRTMVEKLDLSPFFEEAPDLSLDQLDLNDLPQDLDPDVPTANPVGNEPPVVDQAAEEFAALVEARNLLESYERFQFHQVLDLKTKTGQQRRALADFLKMLNREQVGKGVFGMNSAQWSRALSGELSSRPAHEPEGVMLFNRQGFSIDEAFDRDMKKIRRDVVTITFEGQPGNDFVYESGLGEVAQTFGNYFNLRGWSEYSIENPSNASLEKFLSSLESRSYGENDQLMIVLSLPTRDNAFFLGKNANGLVYVSSENGRRLSRLLTAAGHSLLVYNNVQLPADDQQQSDTTTPATDLDASELLSLIQASGNRSAFTTATSISRKADEIESLIVRLIDDMIQRSGGYDKYNKILYPKDENAAEFEFIQGTGDYSIEPQVAEFAKILTIGYQKLKVVDADERVNTITAPFTAPGLNGKTWSEYTFSGVPVAAASDVLKKIIVDVRAAEKAYLVSLVESLNLGEE